MQSSRQHFYAPSTAPLQHSSHVTGVPPPLYIPPVPSLPPYRSAYQMASSNPHAAGAATTQSADHETSSNGTGVAPSPSQASVASEEMAYYSLPDVPPQSRVWGRYRYSLRVVQEPSRARMCGFGDKDRRPLSPPLIAQLLIYDSEIKQQVDYDKNLEWSKMIVSADLWDVNGVREDNCVRNSAQQPAISSTITGSYSTIAQYPAGPQPQLRPFDLAGGQGYHRSPVSPTQAAGMSPHARNGASRPSGQYSNGYPVYNGQNSHPLVNGHLTYNEAVQHRGPSQEPASSPTLALHSRASQDLGQNTTRVEPSKNLIGQSHTSVQKLEDINGNVGLFVIFQDLSVRTEGWFRLKLTLFQLGAVGLEGEQPANGEMDHGLLLEAPCLAWSFSKPFKVYSAKKFPGVFDTTEWSQKFAAQGIKIPIRKQDGARKRNNPNSGEPEYSQSDVEEDD